MLAHSKYWVLTTDIIFPLVLLTLLGVLSWIVFGSSVFAIKNVVCLADYQPCQNENVIVEVNKSIGNNLFLYQTTSLVSKLEQNNFLIKEATITKSLPDKLVVSTESVNPTAALKLQGLTEPNWVVCDQEGRVIRLTTRDPNVITVLVESLPLLRVGQSLGDETLLKSLKLAESLQKTNLTITSLRLDSTTLVLELNSGITALLTTTKDATPQIEALQAILADSTIKLEKYRTVDVRFAQPVIRQN